MRIMQTRYIMPLGIMAFLLGTAAPAFAELPRPSKLPTVPVLKVQLPWPIELKELPESHRDKVAKVVQSPTLGAMAKTEEFPSDPLVYGWLLNHPDRVSLAWRRLGIAAVDIKQVEANLFTWKDGQGSELEWRCLAANEEGRIWYAEGKARAGALLPLVPVKAVAVLRHRQAVDAKGKTVIRHQAEIFLQTDSRAATLITRMLGPAAPKMAEQGAEQVLLFFAGIGEYLDKHPQKGPTLLAEPK